MAKKRFSRGVYRVTQRKDRVTESKGKRGSEGEKEEARAREKRRKRERKRQRERAD